MISQKELPEEVTQYHTRPLSEIADIYVPRKIPKHMITSECTDGIPYVRVSDVQGNQLTHPTDAFVPEDLAGQYAKQLLQEGDLLLSKYAGSHKIAKVTRENLPAIASDGFYIIRCFGIPDTYLYEFYNSDARKKLLDHQLSLVEKGTVIPTIPLRELKELQVPVFDEATMLEIAHPEQLTMKEVLPILEQATDHQARGERQTELDVREAFGKAGWDVKSMLLESTGVPVKTGQTIYCADMVLLNQTDVLAVVEIKSDLSKIQRDHAWITRMKQALSEGMFNNGRMVPFLILSTGYYYETHCLLDGTVLKAAKAPTKEMLLSIMGSTGDGADGKERE